MEVYQIRYFLALAEELNFTKAAEASGVSQPAMTRAIKNLEEEVGCPLFVRDGKRTRLSKAGEVMRLELQKVEGQMKTALRQAKAATGDEPTVLKIGIMCTLTPEIFVPLLKKVRGQGFNVEFELVDLGRDNFEEALLAGTVDGAFVALRNPPSRDFAAHHVFNERMVVGFGKGHRFAEAGELKLSDLDGETYIDRLHCEFREDFISDIAALKIDLAFPYRSERDDWIQSMIAWGFGVALLPETAVKRKDILTRPLVEPVLSRSVVFLTVAGRKNPPALDLMAEYLRERGVALGIEA